MTEEHKYTAHIYRNKDTPKPAFFLRMEPARGNEHDYLVHVGNKTHLTIDQYNLVDKVISSYKEASEDKLMALVERNLAEQKKKE